MKICYIAAPYTGKSTKIPGQVYGNIVDENYKNLLLTIVTTVQKNGFKSILPHEDNNKWGEVYIEPKEMAIQCYRQVKSAELFIAIPSKSRGVHLELGYAIALNKKILVLADQKEKLSSMILGLDDENFRIIHTKFSTSAIKLSINDGLKMLYGGN